MICGQCQSFGKGRSEHDRPIAPHSFPFSCPGVRIECLERICGCVGVCAQRNLHFLYFSFPRPPTSISFALFFCCFFKLSARGFNVACAPSALCEPNELKRAIQSYKIEHIEQESGQTEGFTKCVCVLYAQTSDRCQRTKLTTKEKSKNDRLGPMLARPSTHLGRLFFLLY